MWAANLVEGNADSSPAPLGQHANGKERALRRIRAAGKAGTDDPPGLLGNEVEPPGLPREPFTDESRRHLSVWEKP